MVHAYGCDVWALVRVSGGVVLGVWVVRREGCAAGACRLAVFAAASASAFLRLASSAAARFLPSGEFSWASRAMFFLGINSGPAGLELQCRPWPLLHPLISWHLPVSLARLVL